jgi:tyrosyl-tRNA synthetase
MPDGDATTFAWDRAHPPKVEDLFVAAGLASSKGDARRLIAGKGLYLNERVAEPGEVDVAEIRETTSGSYILLRKGKKNLKALKITGR